jgi:large subunit ribosomal protein L17
LVTALFLHGRIRTSLARAKEIRPLADRMVSLGKAGSLSARRMALQTIYEKSVVKKLFDEIAPQFRDRAGGYTRIIKIDWRTGDHAPMSLLELTQGGREVKAQTRKKKRKDRSAEEKKGGGAEAKPSS